MRAGRDATSLFPSQLPSLLANLLQRRAGRACLLRHANLDHRCTLGFHRTLQRRQKIFSALYRLTMCAERPCERREVWIRETGAVYAIRIVPFLMHPDRAEVVVIHDDENHMQ